MSYLGTADPAHFASTQIRVLHVDDQRDLAELTSDFLERENDDFTVVTETDVENGMDRIASEPIDCVVSDYDMPGHNGLEFLEQVRAEHGDIPFILFTGKGSEEIASEAISAGVTDYLQKASGTDQYTVLANRIENAVEHHRSQRAVEATEEKLLQLAERTDDILFMFDGDWDTLLFINSAYEDIWGGSIAELRDDPTAFLDHIHPDDRARAKRSLKRLQQGEPDTIEYRIHTDEGDQRWVRGETNPIFDDEGNVSRITGFVRDITDQKTREQELQARATAMEAAADGISILNDEQEFIFMNEAHTEIYGFDDPNALLGESWRACYDDADITQFESEILPQFADTGEWHGEMTVTTATGETIHQDLLLKRLDDGRIVRVVRDITDRKEREQELERYKILTKEVTDGISVVDEDGTIQYENPAFEQLLGYDRSTREGTTAFEYMHPEDRQEVMERFASLVADDGPETDRVQYRMQHADGSWRWLESEASARPDSTLDGYVITSRDITERKNRERELERYAAIVDNMTDTAFIIGTDGHLEFANETALTYADVSLAEIEGKPIMKLTRQMAASESDADRFESAVETVTSGGETPTTETVEVQLELPTGEVMAEYQIAAVQIDGEQKVVATGRDITARRHREETLRTLHEVTREFMEASDQQSVAEHAVTTAATVLDQPMSCVWMYDEAEDALTPTAASEKGQNIISETPTFDRGEGLAWEVFESGEPQVYNDLHSEPGRYNPDTPIKSEILLPLGEYGVMAVSCMEQHRFTDIDVALVRVLANTVETALARADREMELREQHRQLKRQNERLEEFAGVVSHDLRNPLQVAEGRLELLREECDSDHLDAIETALQRSDRIIDDVLWLAREGRDIGTMDDVALQEAVDATWNIVADNMEEAKLRYDTEDQSLSSIVADDVRLRQLLENLLWNAVEHGGEDVTVTVGELADGFYIEDTGPGIPEAERDDVFVAGYSTSEKGTGFGLEIVGRVAEAHGWNIDVTEGSTGGARFEITGVEFVAA
jgi:PAS domain S-box-containing protein